MGLDDREQRILAEIERRFYEEDPDLADAVRNITRKVTSPWRQRLLALGVILSIAMVATYLWNVWVALAGFVLLVVSAFFFMREVRGRSGRIRLVNGPDEGESEGRARRFRRPG